MRQNKNASRLKLHEELCKALGSRNCYYQPPESLKLQFPCIVYYRYRIETKKADNHAYNKVAQYTVTYIHKDPESDVTYDILDRFVNCRMDRTFTSDNLYHDVYTLYF